MFRNLKYMLAALSFGGMVGAAKGADLPQPEAKIPDAKVLALQAELARTNCYAGPQDGQPSQALEDAAALAHASTMTRYVAGDADRVLALAAQYQTMCSQPVAPTATEVLAHAQGVPVQDMAKSPEMILTLQKALRQAGCYHGPVDGIDSPDLQSAVFSFNATTGMNITTDPATALKTVEKAGGEVCLDAETLPWQTETKTRE